jgi:hypothetical protein
MPVNRYSRNNLVWLKGIDEFFDGRRLRLLTVFGDSPGKAMLNITLKANGAKNLPAANVQ